MGYVTSGIATRQNIKKGGILARALAGLVSLLVPVAALADDCACEKAVCKQECEDTAGVRFYTDKCDGGRKIKSCRRPICVPKDPLPPLCANPNSQLNPGAVSKKDETVKSGDGEGEGEVHESIGVVVVSAGRVWFVRKGENRERARIGNKVHLYDRVKTEAGARIKILFVDKNVISLAESSELLINEYVFDLRRNRKKTNLVLVQGKLRSEVKQRYDGHQNTYTVRTPAAVAGVRGTDFLTVVDGAGSTEVATLTGLVHLGARADQREERPVPAGSRLLFTTDGSQVKVADEDGRVSEVPGGDFGLMQTMSPEESEKLRREMTFEQSSMPKNSVPNRALEEDALAVAKSNEDEPICQQPPGPLNHCAWSCEGEGLAQNKTAKGQKCPTRASEVFCVRRRCNAAGRWSDPHRLPALYSGECRISEVRVGPCDY